VDVPDDRLPLAEVAEDVTDVDSRVAAVLEVGRE
jgi:hypothetical protein